MPSIISYFIPNSNMHSNFGYEDKFYKLSGHKQIVTVALTALALIISIPILGLGGLAVFRALTRKFTPINLSRNEEGEQVVVIRTAQKTQKAYIDLLTAQKTQKACIDLLLGFYLDRKYKLVDDDKPYESLQEEKDTFFRVIAKSINSSEAKVRTELSEYIEQNPEQIQAIHSELHLETDANYPIDVIKNFLNKENSFDTVIRDYPAGEAYATSFQFMINTFRVKILTRIHNDMKIIIHKNLIVNYEAPHNKVNNSIRCRQILYGSGQNEIEMATGEHLTEAENPNSKPVFIQPRLIVPIE